MEGGALELTSKSQDDPVYLTRYFVEPQSGGKVFASMLVRFQALEPESIGEINWLVQNGWNGPTEQQVSLTFQNDGIYLKQSDPLKGMDSINWVTKYDNQVVCVNFEFDLDATGKDTLNVYINPAKGETLLMLSVTLYGELTFDRLQFKPGGRPGGTMQIDEILIGTKLADVIY